MKRIVSCTCIMALAVSLTLSLSVMAGTKAEAASSVEEARQRMLQEDRKKEEEAHRGAAAYNAEVLRKAQAAGSEFIAISDSLMNYADAAAFCKRHGGKLPRINNSASWDGMNPPFRGILIDGFGYGARPWEEVGLPNDVYWTGTAGTGVPGYSWIVGGHGRNVDVVGSAQSNLRRVVCVP